MLEVNGITGGEQNCWRSMKLPLLEVNKTPAARMAGMMKCTGCTKSNKFVKPQRFM